MVVFGGFLLIVCVYGNGLGEMMLIGFLLMVGVVLMWVILNLIGWLVN